MSIKAALLKIGYHQDKQLRYTDQAKQSFEAVKKWKVKLAGAIDKDVITAGKHWEEENITIFSIPAIVLVQSLTGLPDNKLLKFE